MLSAEAKPEHVSKYREKATFQPHLAISYFVADYEPLGK